MYVLSIDVFINHVLKLIWFFFCVCYVKFNDIFALFWWGTSDVLNENKSS